MRNLSAMQKMVLMAGAASAYANEVYHIAYRAGIESSPGFYRSRGHGEGSLNRVSQKKRRRLNRQIGMFPKRSAR